MTQEEIDAFFASEEGKKYADLWSSLNAQGPNAGLNILNTGPDDITGNAIRNAPMYADMFSAIRAFSGRPQSQDAEFAKNTAKTNSAYNSYLARAYAQPGRKSTILTEEQALGSKTLLGSGSMSKSVLGSM